MPTYGYECLSCENQFETFQSIKADALTTCEACGGVLRKRIYPVGISFKGSGFYVNDYAPPGSSRSKSAESDGGAPTASDSTSSGEGKAVSPSDGAKTETKSETKADAASVPKAESKAESKSETKAPAATT